MNNELVEKIAIYSGFYVSDTGNGPAEIHSKWIEGEPLNTEVENVIKNTIQECLTLVEGTFWTYQAMDKIREHFGVE